MPDRTRDPFHLITHNSPRTTSNSAMPVKVYSFPRLFLIGGMDIQSAVKRVTSKKLERD